MALLIIFFACSLFVIPEFFLKRLSAFGGKWKKKYPESRVIRILSMRKMKA